MTKRNSLTDMLGFLGQTAVKDGIKYMILMYGKRYEKKIKINISIWLFEIIIHHFHVFISHMPTLDIDFNHLKCLSAL